MSEKEQYAIVGSEYAGEGDYMNVIIFKGTKEECIEYCEKNSYTNYLQYRNLMLYRADKVPKSYI